MINISTNPKDYPENFTEAKRKDYVFGVKEFCELNGINFLLTSNLNDSDQKRGAIGAPSFPDFYIYTGRFLDYVNQQGLKNVSGYVPEEV